MSFQCLEQLTLPYSLRAHTAFNLVIESQVLKGNPLGDSPTRHNYILAPKGSWQKLPVVFHLSGYFSTGYQIFGAKTLQDNFIEKLDRLVQQKKVAKAIHVFVEATTFWGGSQFINSHGCGRYSDYILKELWPAVQSEFSVSGKSKDLYLIGGSSGGYGALSLVSEKNSPFGVAMAVAPDSFFEASLLPELFKAIPELAKYKSLRDLRKAITNEEIQGKKSFFNLVNVVAMAHCYTPAKAIGKEKIQFPVDLHTGAVDRHLWKEWLKHDPIHFLQKRSQNLKGKRIYLDVGKYDNFSLQLGTRQIHAVLKKARVKTTYSEFSGNHFGLSERRLLLLQQL